MVPSKPTASSSSRQGSTGTVWNTACFFFFFKGLVAGCHSFCLFWFFITYIHAFNHNTFIRRHSLKPLSMLINTGDRVLPYEIQHVDQYRWQGSTVWNTACWSIPVTGFYRMKYRMLINTGSQALRCSKNACRYRRINEYEIPRSPNRNYCMAAKHANTHSDLHFMMTRFRFPFGW